MSVDFTRHIVNPILSKFIDAKKSEHVKILSEIRKHLGEMEEKYKFSSYGGNPSMLSEFLSSSDFDAFAKIFKTYGLKEVLIRILEETKEAYKHDVEIVKASSMRLMELGINGTQTARVKKQVLNPDTISTSLKNKIPGGEIISKGNVISVRLGEEFLLKVRLGKKAVELNVRAKLGLEDHNLLLRKIERIVDCLK